MSVATSGFHAGELAVQRRAGVRAAADRLVGMLDAPDLTGGIARWLADRTFLAVTARDHDDRLWISPMPGPEGFLEVTGPAELRVHTTPGPGDPLYDVAAGQPIGMITLDFARRRRVRINGTLTRVDAAAGITVRVEQAYGNCPQYIRRRVLDTGAPAGPPAAVRRGGALADADADLVRRADTFLLGTTHPERGADASHRGGPTGFVRVLDDRTLWWPDYPGNNMLNSLGNLTVDPTAALVFLDFDSGDTLHLSGTARVDWAAPAPVDDAGTGRGVVFTLDALVAR